MVRAAKRHPRVRVATFSQQPAQLRFGHFLAVMDTTGGEPLHPRAEPAARGCALLGVVADQRGCHIAAAVADHD